MIIELRQPVPSFSDVAAAHLNLLDEFGVAKLELDAVGRTVTARAARTDGNGLTTVAVQAEARCGPDELFVLETGIEIAVTRCARRMRRALA